jgi:DNA polymerase-3 subunit gamma/tau
MDILEIDAASNRGIDEIRELREKIKLSPAEGSYKVYIIDEVHMLTPEAFNALLKTLEEPPEHAVFILATTEPHKIPMTILSRCQRYDFHRIALEEIVGRLKLVIDEGGYQAEEEALRLIAKMAAGGLRDALGMLDQCLSASEESLSTSRVADIIGIAEDEFLHVWVEYIRLGQTAKALLALQDALQRGKQAGQLLRDLIQYFRDLLILQLGEGSMDLVSTTSEQALLMRSQGESIGRDSILTMVEQLAPLQNKMKYEGDGQLLLEVEVIKLSRLFEVSKATIVEPKPVVAEERVVEKKSPVAPKEESFSKERVAAIVEEKPVSEPVEVSEEEVPQVSTVVPEATTIDVDGLWNQVLQSLKEQKEITTLAFVKEGTPKIEKGRLILRFPKAYEFHKGNAEKPEHKKIVEECLMAAGGSKCALICVLEEETVQKEEMNTSDIVNTVKRIFGEDKIIIMED